MNNYQLTILIRESLDDKSRLSLLDSLKGDFSKILKEDLWGIRGMSYPIKRQNKAYYAHFEFEVEPKNISSLDKKLKLNEDIIRYLIIRK